MLDAKFSKLLILFFISVIGIVFASLIATLFSNYVSMYILFFESYYLIFGILTLLLGFISKNLVKDKEKEFQIISGVTGSLPISLISSYISYQAEILNELREHTVQFQEKAVTSGEAQIVTGNPVEPLIVFFILMISYNLPLLYDLIGTKDKPKVRYLSFYLIPIFIYILTPIILSNIA